jgi:hypothetical protein
MTLNCVLSHFDQLNVPNAPMMRDVSALLSCQSLLWHRRTGSILDDDPLGQQHPHQQAAEVLRNTKIA